MPKGTLRWFAIVAVVVSSVSTPTVEARGLLDWLFHRHRRPAAALPATGCATAAPGFMQYAPQTAFQVSYLRVPVTYYRPVTTLDPATQCPVVTMQPCTTFTWQARRVPNTAFVPVRMPSPAFGGAPGTPCSSPQAAPGHGFGQQLQPMPGHGFGQQLQPMPGHGFGQQLQPMPGQGFGQQLQPMPGQGVAPQTGAEPADIVPSLQPFPQQQQQQQQLQQFQQQWYPPQQLQQPSYQPQQQSHQPQYRQPHATQPAVQQPSGQQFGQQFGLDGQRHIPSRPSAGERPDLSPPASGPAQAGGWLRPIPDPEAPAGIDRDERDGAADRSGEPQLGNPRDRTARQQAPEAWAVTPITWARPAAAPIRHVAPSHVSDPAAPPVVDDSGWRSVPR